MVFPDFTLPFILDTDACQCGIGAVSCQPYPDGTEKVVTFASCVISKAERKYSVTRKELLAAVTYIHHFRPFLLGQHFVLCTDHGSLQWLHTMKEPEGQLARWLECLHKYNFEIQHRKGHHHQNADALSQHPSHFSDESPTEDIHPTANLCLVTTQQNDELVERSISDLKELQQADEVVSPILKAVSENQKPSPKTLSGKDRKIYLLL